jgi:hypothetical protein
LLQARSSNEFAYICVSSRPPRYDELEAVPTTIQHRDYQACRVLVAVLACRWSHVEPVVCRSRAAIAASALVRGASLELTSHQTRSSHHHMLAPTFEAPELQSYRHHREYCCHYAEQQSEAVVEQHTRSVGVMLTTRSVCEEVLTTCSSITHKE